MAAPVPLDVRVLTIRQPWADCIVHGSRAYGPKRVENRTRPIPPALIGARVLIHAAKAPATSNSIVMVRDYDWPDVRAAVIGEARIVSCHQANHTGALCCAPWGFEDHWHWQLEDVLRYAEPIPARGQLGLWKPSQELLAAADAQAKEANAQ